MSANANDLPEKYKRMFGTMTDDEMALVIGRCRNTARKMRLQLGVPALQKSKLYKNIPWEKYNHLFGNCPDRVIATTVGCCIRLIRKHRKELGIAAFQREPTIRWDIFDKMLGNYTDAEIAKLVGCTRSSVWYRRNQLGILPNYAIEFGKEMKKMEKDEEEIT